MDTDGDGCDGWLRSKVQVDLGERSDGKDTLCANAGSDDKPILGPGSDDWQTDDKLEERHPDSLPANISNIDLLVLFGRNKT